LEDFHHHVDHIEKVVVLKFRRHHLHEAHHLPNHFPICFLFNLFLRNLLRHPSRYLHLFPSSLHLSLPNRPISPLFKHHILPFLPPPPVGCGPPLLFLLCRALPCRLHLTGRRRIIQVLLLVVVTEKD